MRDRTSRIVSALDLRDRVVLAAGAATLIAAAFLSAIGDVSWLVPLTITCLYGIVVYGAWNRAERRHSSAVGDEGRFQKQSMQPALSVAYWSFFMLLLGLAMAWAAVSQLIRQGGSVFSFVLLTVGVLLIGVAVFVMASMLRHKSKSK
jgi:Ca2+/Na+ antiporter